MSILLTVVSGALSYFIWLSLSFPIYQMGKMGRNFHLLNVRHSDKHILYIPSHLIFTQTLKIIYDCSKFTELEIETQKVKVVSQDLKVQ